jgi:ion channel-forming bestrophin family protein
MLLKNNIPIGYVFGKVKIELLIILVYSLAIAVIHEWVLEVPISIPLTIPAILGTVISLLLGFRSNQAYDRWWEARQIWGAVVNDSRTLARQILSFTESQYEEDEVQQMRQRMIRRQMAWCYALGQSLRRLNPTSGLDKFLNRRDLESLARYNNVPMALLDQHARDLRRCLEEGYINRYQQIELDKTLTRLCDAMGKCERIKNTVFPSTYSLYIHFSLLLFICMLPFGVIDYFGFLEVPLVVAISACFLLIEKMAIHLQDPFENKPTDTPMTAIASNIEKDLRQLLHDQELPEEKRSEAFYYIL